LKYVFPVKVNSFNLKVIFILRLFLFSFSNYNNPFFCKVIIFDEFCSFFLMSLLSISGQLHVSFLLFSSNINKIQKYVSAHLYYLNWNLHCQSLSFESFTRKVLS
jgi:hypothetical protein